MKIIDLEKAAEKDCYDNVRKEVSKKLDTIALIAILHFVQNAK